jgi:membrane protease YdiL (CAAX protease family)
MTVTSELPSRSPLAPVFAAIVVWCLGAALTPWLGVWGGVGGAALVVGAGFAARYPKVLRPLCHVQRLAVLQGIAAGIVMIAATYALFPIVTYLAPEIGVGTRDLYRLFNSGPAELRLLLPLVILGEELVWRGVIQSAVTRRLGPTVGVLTTALVYAAAHAPVGAPLLTLVAGCCGIYWGLLRARTGSLIVPLIAHLMWDLVVMLWLPLAR